MLRRPNRRRLPLARWSSCSTRRGTGPCAGSPCAGSHPRPCGPAATTSSASPSSWWTTWSPADGGRVRLRRPHRGAVPIAVIAWILGVPREDVGLLFRWTNEVIGKDDPEFRREGETPGQTIKRARGELHAYFGALVEERRREPRRRPRERAGRGGDRRRSRSPRSSSCRYCELLVEAGNETTRNAISGGLLALIEHPDQWEKLRGRSRARPRRRRGDPALGQPDHPLHPHRDRGHRGPRGRRSAPASRWPSSSPRRTATRRCSTTPSRSAIDRRPNPHLAFGFGEHFCMGAHLARVEMETCLPPARRPPRGVRGRRAGRAARTPPSTAASSTSPSATASPDRAGGTTPVLAPDPPPMTGESGARTTGLASLSASGRGSRRACRT